MVIHLGDAFVSTGNSKNSFMQSAWPLPWTCYESTEFKIFFLVAFNKVDLENSQSLILHFENNLPVALQKDYFPPMLKI